MKTGAMIGRGMVRSVGQIAVSVVATLIATQIYAGLQRSPSPVLAKTVASLTAGGKYDARIAGAALPVAEPERPALSIVDWAITPVRPTSLVADVAFTLDDDITAPAIADPALKPAEPFKLPDPSPKPARHDPKRIAAATAAPTVIHATAAKPLDPALPPAAPVAAHHTGLLAMATSTAQDVASLGGSVVAMGTTVVGHLLPWGR